MGAAIDEDDDIIAGINITPMVDIMLVLLIIFMLTASVIEDKSIRVELPEAQTASKTDESPLGVTIDADGNWYLNGEPTTEEQLRLVIRAEKAADKDVQVIIDADHRVPYGTVVLVIDLAKQEGVVRYALNTDPTSARLFLDARDEDEDEGREPSGG
jgi:biopolymer transport protein ExbD